MHRLTLTLAATILALTSLGLAAPAHAAKPHPPVNAYTAHHMAGLMAEQFAEFLTPGSEKITVGRCAPKPLNVWECPVKIEAGHTTCTAVVVLWKSHRRHQFDLFWGYLRALECDR